MAKPKSAFKGKFRQEINPMDPVLRECKRKTAYPIRSMAEKDAHAASITQNEEMEVYTCQHCGKFHWGHKMKNPPPEEPQVVEPEVLYKKASVAAVPRAPRNWLPPEKPTQNVPQIDTTDLGKLRDDFRNVYIFRMPTEMPHTESNMLDHGVLVAMKKGDDVYKEPDGTSSPANKWRAYHHNVSTTYSRLKPLDFQKRIGPHVDGFGKEREEPVDTDTVVDKTPVLGNAVLTPALAKKLTEGTAEGKAEEYKGRKIWRDDKNRAFLKKEIPCASCKDPIVLLSRVYEPNGVFTVSLAYKAVEDPKARPTSEGKRSWLCGKCASPSKKKVEPKPQEEEKLISTEEQEWMNASLGAYQEETAKVEPQKEEEPDFLTALQQMTEDNTVPSERIRGMAFIAVQYLKER